MIRTKQVSAAVASIAIIATLVGDKVMDAAVAVITDDGVQRNEVLSLLVFLVFISLVIWALQSGILKLFSKLLRTVRRTDEFNSLESELETARKTIKQGLRYLKSQGHEFDKHVDSAVNKVATLNPSDPRFEEHRHQAAGTVFLLKEDYHRNINSIQESIDRLYENITVAEEIFLDVDEWASKTASKYFKPHTDSRPE
jgi:hypothetical protein